MDVQKVQQYQRSSSQSTVIDYRGMKVPELGISKKRVVDQKCIQMRISLAFLGCVNNLNHQDHAPTHNSQKTITKIKVRIA